MKLKPYSKEECLRQAVEIAKGYARSGENKHGPVPEFLEAVYRKIVELKTEIASLDIDGRYD